MYHQPTATHAQIEHMYTVIHLTMLAATSLFVVFIVFLIPLISQAATYAYVAQNGEVRSVESGDAMTAIVLAPLIHPRSGVLLITSSSSRSIIGTRVSGI